MGKQRANDAATKAVLAQYGDDESQLHAVEHHFVAADSASLEALAIVGRELGFKPSAIRETEREKRACFYFDLVSKTATPISVLSRESILMIALGEAFSATYDGWGTGIVKRAKAPTKVAKKVAKSAKKKTAARKR